MTAAFVAAVAIGVSDGPSPSYLSGTLLSGLARRVARHELIVRLRWDVLCRSSGVLVRRASERCAGVVSVGYHLRWSGAVDASTAGERSMLAVASEAAAGGGGSEGDW